MSQGTATTGSNKRGAIALRERIRKLSKQNDTVRETIAARRMGSQSSELERFPAAKAAVQGEVL
jgi:hypothetical protein